MPTALGEPPSTPTTLDELLMQPKIWSILVAMDGKYGPLHLTNAHMLFEPEFLVPLGEGQTALKDGETPRAVLYDIMNGELGHGEKIAEGAIYFGGKNRHAVTHMVISNDMLWRNPTPASYRQ